MKGLINIKNRDNKCFLWCHIRHLIPLKRHSERISKADKKTSNDLDYKAIKFPVSKKDYCKQYKMDRPGSVLRRKQDKFKKSSP